MDASHKLYEAFRSPTITNDGQRLEIYADMKARSHHPAHPYSRLAVPQSTAESSLA